MSSASTDLPPTFKRSWIWVFIISIAILFFLTVVGLAGAAFFWRQLASAKSTLNSVTEERDSLERQLADTQTRLAAATQKNREPLAEDMSLVTSLTNERNGLAAQLAAKDTKIAALTAERDTLARQVSTSDVKPAALPPSDNVPLPARLDAEFNALLPTDPQRTSIKEAARLFEETDRSSHWTSYLEALEIIREHRSKAAIPLLMKYALKQQSFNGSSGKQFSDAITILTGEEIVFPARGRDNSQVEAAVKNLYENWYLKNKPDLTVDLNKMSDEQRRRVGDALLRGAKEARRNEHSSNGIAYEANTVITYRLKQSVDDPKHSGRPAFYAADLCPAMVPILLESAGWVKGPQTTPPPAVSSLPVEIIPMLALLRKDGVAPELDKIANDPQQGNCARLTCLLALHTAGERISADSLIAIATQEKSLELRVYAIVAMQYTPGKGTAAKLVEFLNDSNGEIVAAACWSLGYNPTPDAVAPLKKIISKGDMKPAMFPAISALGKTKCYAASEALAVFMSNELQNNSSERYVYDALSAFCDSSGCPRRAGVRRKEDVTVALEWWERYKANLK